MSAALSLHTSRHSGLRAAVVLNENTQCCELHTGLRTGLGGSGYWSCQFSGVGQVGRL